MNSEIFVINTGGTFNKQEVADSSEQIVNKSDDALQDLFSHWRNSFEVTNIIGKDSLEFNDNDRELLKKTIDEAKSKKIIVIHGTDTMYLSAKIIDDLQFTLQQKTVVFVGAMIPYSINPIEATANFAAAVGYLQGMVTPPSVMISMNGLIGDHTTIIKDRIKEKFIHIDNK